MLTLVEKFVPGTSDDDLDSTVQEWMDFQVATHLPEFIEVDAVEGLGWPGQVRSPGYTHENFSHPFLRPGKE